MDTEEERRRQAGQHPENTQPQRQPDQQAQPVQQQGQTPVDILNLEAVKQELERIQKSTPEQLGFTPLEKRQAESALAVALQNQEGGRIAKSNIDAFLKMPKMSVPDFQNNVYKDRINRLNNLITSGSIDTAFLRGDLEFFQSLAQDSSINNHDRTMATQAANELVAAIQRMHTIDQMRSAVQQSMQEEQGERRELTGATGITIAEVIQAGKEGRRAREKIFNDILMEVEATPNKPFDQVFSVMTSPYNRYQYLKSILLSLSERGDFQGMTRNWSADKINQIRREAKADLIRFEKELNVRKVLHDALQVIYNPSVKAEQIFDYIQGFSSEDGEYAFKMTGVKEMMDLYEAGLRQVMAENNGYLFVEDVLGKVEKKVIPGDTPGQNDQYTVLQSAVVDARVKAAYKKLYNRKKIRVVGSDGKSYFVGGDGDLTDADVDKIFTMARGMMVTSLRLLSIASESRIPQGGMYTSLFMQDALQQYGSYLQHLIGKFSIGGKGLALAIREVGGEKVFGNFIKHFGIGKMKELLHALTSNPDAFLYAEELPDGTKLPENLYIRNKNPNRAGDVFTWISWRLKENPDDLSMAKDFIRRGMFIVREENGVKTYEPGILLRQLCKQLNIPEDVMLSFLKERTNVDSLYYTKPNPDMKDAVLHMTMEEIIIKNIVDYQFSNLSKEEREQAEKEIKDYLAEYGKWIGTGIRFEALRGKLESGEEIGKATKLLQRMVELQPHRLYEISKKIRGRLSKTLGMNPEELRDALEGLRFIEQHMLTHRDELLADGKSFDGISRKYIKTADKVELDFDSLVQDVKDMSLDNFGGSQEKKDKAIQEAEHQKVLVMRLYQKIQQDYAHNSDLYHREFITYRNYNHGYVLWTGDAPLDEFDVALLGPTGGFARRARDNKANAEAAGLEVGMIAGAKNNMTVDEVMNTLAGIHEKISAYDAGKAQTAVAEKAANIIELFRGQWFTDVPVVGQLVKSFGHGSLARKLWGPEAALWTKTEINHFIETLAHKELISHEDAERLMHQYGATDLHVGQEVTIMMVQFAILALIMYMAQQLLKEETH